MIRLTSTPPSPYNLGLLREQAFAKWPKLIDVNELDNGAEIAFYFPNKAAPQQATVDTFLAAHDGTQKDKGELEREVKRTLVARLRAVDSVELDKTAEGQIIHDILRVLDFKAS